MGNKVFILSPASTAGRRAAILLSEAASFDLAARMRRDGRAELGEVFAFLSGLYFRGKRIYAERFASPPPGLDGAFVITSCSGLKPLGCRISKEELIAFAAVPIHAEEPRFTEPFRESAEALRTALSADDHVVLLGSIASDKYSRVLSEIFGDRLLYPPSFIGRGDMSRGGLLLRAAASGEELEYEPLDESRPRRGKRPPKLVPMRQERSAE